MNVIEARGLRKTFGKTIALDGVDLHIAEGRILGLIGPNGAGKSTALNAILGLTAYEGELKVLGRDPWSERDQLMRDVCFIADVAVLPRWLPWPGPEALGSVKSVTSIQSLTALLLLQASCFPQPVFLRCFTYQERLSCRHIEPQYVVHSN
jgi:ABC-type uncharacterized transport system ATPase subunit